MVAAISVSLPLLLLYAYAGWPCSASAHTAARCTRSTLVHNALHTEPVPTKLDIIILIVSASSSLQDLVILHAMQLSKFILYVFLCYICMFNCFSVGAMLIVSKEAQAGILSRYHPLVEATVNFQLLISFSALFLLLARTQIIEQDSQVLLLIVFYSIWFYFTVFWLWKSDFAASFTVFSDLEI